MLASMCVHTANLSSSDYSVNLILHHPLILTSSMLYLLLIAVILESQVCMYVCGRFGKVSEP